MNKGCGKRKPIDGCEEYFPTVGAICGDNRMHKEGDKPNLCEECSQSLINKNSQQKNERMVDVKTNDSSYCHNSADTSIKTQEKEE